jgi:uncharacterized protein (DUF302 family)
MVAGAEVKTQSFEGVRLERRTPKAFDAVLSALRSRMGVASIPALVSLAERQVDAATFEDEVTRRFVGSSGFMLFDEFNHGGWLAIYGIRRRTVRWVYGNPLIAVSMIRHDVTAGLFAPVEMLITEMEGGAGTVVTYVRASSLMVIDDNAPLLAAALALDAKVEALLDDALTPD